MPKSDAPKPQQTYLSSWVLPKSSSSSPSTSRSHSSSPILPPNSSSLPPQSAPPRSNHTQKQPVPLQVSIRPFEENHVQPLRRINSLLLPMNYPDSFYSNILTPPHSFSKVIIWTDPAPKVIGGVVCRLEPTLAPESTEKNPVVVTGSYCVYLQSLALLSPYRERGIAAKALEAVIEAAREWEGGKIRELYAHVWPENHEALGWYAARGFVVDKTPIHGYYRRLRPDTAWIVRRKIVPSDFLQTNPPEIQLGGNTVEESANAEQGGTNSNEGLRTAAGTSQILEPTPTDASKRPTVLHTKSFQDRRPDMEWNDLPEDVLKTSSPLLRPTDGSTPSSRSSSRGAPKKKRTYPAASFSPLGGDGR